MSINEITFGAFTTNPVYENQKTKTVQPTKPPPVHQDDQHSVQTTRPDTINHVVMLYDQHGKVCIKFMDYNNNVIYQVPTEITMKWEEWQKPSK